MRRQPPGPTGEVVFGNSRRYARDPFSFLTACADAYGDVVRLELGPLDTYMLTNPVDIERVLVSEASKFRKPQFQDDALGDLLGNGLLLSEGREWARQRDLASPAFHASRLPSLVRMITDETERVLDGWCDSDVVAVEREMARLTVNVIAEAMFGASLTNTRVERIQEHLEPLGKRFEPNPLRFVTPNWVPTRENRDFRRSVAVLETVIADVVAERRGTEGETDDRDAPMDLLSILLRAQRRGEQTDRQLRDELMTMLLAGHDTTALALTYTWYLLATHPDIERRVHAELDAVLGGETPTMADVRDLDLVDRVLQESMRLYPPVYVLFREPLVDVKLGGYRVPSRSAVLLPQWVVHRSPRYWTAPETFDPDRFTPERRRDRPRFAYFPFGGGARHCIGKQFSMLEATLVVATVAQRFELDDTGTGELALRGSLTMHPKGSLRMRVHEREATREAVR